MGPPTEWFLPSHSFPPPKWQLPCGCCCKNQYYRQTWQLVSAVCSTRNLHSPFFFWKWNIPRFLVSLHRWNSHFSFGETEDANAYSWAGFTELGSGLNKRIPLSLQHDSQEFAVVTYHHIYLGGELCQGLSTGQIQSHPNQLGFGDVFKPKRTRACLGQRAQVLSSLQTRHKPPTTNSHAHQALGILIKLSLYFFLNPARW